MLNDVTAEELRVFSDEQLVQNSKNGSQSAFAELALRYIFIIRSKAFDLYNTGVESEDLLQEGLIALHGAVCSFKPESGASFRTYAAVCIKNRLISAVRSANTEKNRINGNTVSLESGAELLSDQSSDPEYSFIIHEERDLLMKSIKNSLSEMEFKVLMLYLEGKSYEEISNTLDITVKSCGNAMQRVRGKLKVLL